MKKITKPTVTIGIPAYNEEGMLPILLDSLIAQKQRNFVLEEIVIAIDGSTDNTGKVGIQYKRRYSYIKIIGNKQRPGKAIVLNNIYKESQSDYLLTIDADTYLEDEFTLERMMERMLIINNLNLVGARHKPIMPKTYMGKFAAYSYIILEDAFLKLNNGNNMYAIMTNELMPKRFYKSFLLPKHTISDQCYVYAKATEKDKAKFSLVKNAVVRFIPVSTFHDWRLLSARSIKGDKDDVVKHFGEKVLSSYTLPKLLYLKSAIKFFFKSPVNTIGALLMNILIRMFPYKKRVVKNGMWQTTLSSKRISYI